jgi:hypothetical protein
MEVASMTQPDQANGVHSTSIAMDASMDIDMDIDLGPLPEPEPIETVSENGPNLSALLSRDN